MEGVKHQLQRRPFKVIEVHSIEEEMRITKTNKHQLQQTIEFGTHLSTQRKIRAPPICALAWEKSAHVILYSYKAKISLAYFSGISLSHVIHHNQWVHDLYYPPSTDGQAGHWVMDHHLCPLLSTIEKRAICFVKSLIDTGSPSPYGKASTCELLHQYRLPWNW
jgi:hypothetical protein